MSCARGCCPTPAEHFRSLHVASPDRRAMRKVTDLDGGRTGTASVTEHWHDRQDVLIRPATVRAAYDSSTGRLENLDG
jgi:hypothetical protein